LWRSCGAGVPSKRLDLRAAQWRRSGGTKAAAISEFTELLERQDEACRKLLQWVKNYDVILCPASGKHGRAPINFGDDPFCAATLAVVIPA
jgi:hypothetical protein